MGILNTTPDSFSDGGRFVQKKSALKHAEHMIDEGVDILDIGGESTRPGAESVSVQEEIDRVLPLIEALKGSKVPISVDTSKPEVMQEAIYAGASMINDVYALQAEGAIEVVANSQVELCLMHMQGTPGTMQKAPRYLDPVTEVKDFLQQRIVACVEQGINKDRICLDPGIGFGKNLEHNCQLLKHLDSIVIDGLPLLVGISRKNMLGQILKLEVSERLNASVNAALLAITKGAKIVRVHDVKETRQAVDLYNAIEFS